MLAFTFKNFGVIPRNGPTCIYAIYQAWPRMLHGLYRASRLKGEVLGFLCNPTELAENWTVILPAGIFIQTWAVLNNEPKLAISFWHFLNFI